ncbi:MAG TPA: F0F1 ATP synthase subunit gamma [Patescibacteria group bacterium]|nr:F0F1 ATP synthase subunit gamma [Patescibacteria group bacterium]
MLNKKQIDSLINQLDSMKTLIQTYEEIAAMDMRKIRNNVLTNRSFIDELDDIYQQLQISYQEKLTHLLIQKSSKNKIISKKNGKTVSVFLSANVGLYGDIVQQTFVTFLNFIKTHQTDIVVVGKLGQSLMKDNDPDQPFTFIDLPDTNIKKEDLTDLLSLLLKYENIYFFYGKFQSLVTQKPFMLDVYGQAAQLKRNVATTTQYLFEPNLEIILQFFETQIFGTIIEQSFHESELAKYSARMVALDQDTENINNQTKKINLQRRIVLHHLQNQKQQQTLIYLSNLTTK